MTRQILLIDDDKDVHAHIQIVLQKTGYNLISAFDGIEGLKKVLSFNPDLIILDYLMPRKGGAETFRELKESPQYKRGCDIPVIMLTAANQPTERINNFLEAGLNAYLEKPFGSKELINVIENTFITNKIKVHNSALRKAIENSKNFLENLIESCPIAIITCELDGKITFASKAIEDILGYFIFEILGKSVYELLGTSEEVLTKRLENRTSPNELVTIGVYVEAKSGIQIPMGITYSYLLDQNSDIQGLLIVGQDLSAQKQLEKELLEKERLTAITQSFATINHEINNPLTPILGNIQLIRKEDCLLSDDHKKKLEIIECNVKKISNIVQKFNGISNPEEKPYYGNSNIFEI